MNEDRPGYRTLTPLPLITVCLPSENTPAARVDAALARLQLHLTYGRYAGYLDTIREDVETVFEAWREYRQESQA